MIALGSVLTGVVRGNSVFSQTDLCEIPDTAALTLDTMDAQSSVHCAIRCFSEQEPRCEAYIFMGKL